MLNLLLLNQHLMILSIIYLILKSSDPKIFFFQKMFLHPQRIPKIRLKNFLDEKDLEEWLKESFWALAYHSMFLPSFAYWIPPVAPTFPARLFGPLAFSGISHRSSLQIFRAPGYPRCKVRFAERSIEVWWPKPEEARGPKSRAEKARPWEKCEQAGASRAPTPTKISMGQYTCKSKC